LMKTSATKTSFLADVVFAPLKASKRP